jgi:threonine dehydrogenase-like Zn-dependent dehydrogenase
MQHGLCRIRRGGTLPILGVAGKVPTASFSPVASTTTSCGSSARWPSSTPFERVRDGDALVTHRPALDDHANAVDAFRRGEGLKILIAPSA